MILRRVGCLLLLLLLLGLVGCRTSSPPARRAGSATPAEIAARARLELPGGVTCLLKLRQLGVPHRVVRAIPNIHTPVELTGPVGGIDYLPLSRRAPIRVCDCRLALALARAAPVLRSLGVEAMFYSSFYRRAGRGGKLSRHAMGLAVDVHRVRFSSGTLRVEDDFDRGEDSSRCEATSALLNRLACRLSANRLFDRVLTPHTDAAHHNHFHLAILSLERRRRPPSRRLPPPVIAD